MNMMQMFMSSKNPMDALQTIVNNNPRMRNNPLFNNAVNMANNGDSKGLEIMARNLANQNGTDINQMMNMVNNMFGRK